MTENDFVPKHELKLPNAGKITYKAPSNIALVKYWGKNAHQIPANPSISFTLDACATTTSLSYKLLEKKTDDFSFDLFFEGKPKEEFNPKIFTFFERVAPYMPFLHNYHFTIETSNSFPHSSGIASSASGMAALALCLMDLERQGNQEITASTFNQKASFLARLGSGSACRSIEGNLVQWGRHEGTPKSTDLYGIKFPFKKNAIFENYHDTILLVDKGQKEVSSSVGHGLMKNHPFALKRFEQAHHNLDTLKGVFQEGDLDEFIKIVESEALTLHAMMLTSMPYYILMKPNTLRIINSIWEFRRQSKLPICFTLDAGANVHVLYPESDKEKVIQFIQDELILYCEKGQYICDRIGQGGRKLL